MTVNCHVEYERVQWGYSVSGYISVGKDEITFYQVTVTDSANVLTITQQQYYIRLQRLSGYDSW